MFCCSKKETKEPEIDVEAKLKEVEDRLDAKIMELSSSVINDFTAELTELKDQLLLLQQEKAQNEKVLHSSSERHTQQIHDVRQELIVKVEQHSEELQELRESKTQEAEIMRQEFQEKISQQLEELRKVDQKHFCSFQELSELQKLAQSHSERLAEELKKCQQVMETHHVEIHKEIQVTREAASGETSTQCSQLRGGLEEVNGKLAESKSALQSSVQSVEETIQHVRRGFENSIADCLERMVQEEQSARVREEDLRLLIKENLFRIEDNTQLAQNVYCRSVRWNCRGLKWRMAHVLTQEKEARLENPGVRSPEFSLCSLPKMQLELCLAARSLAQDEAPTAPLPVPGSCSIRLWVQPGIEMTFRITVGEGEKATSRRFDHSFLEPLEGHSHVPFEVLNFCMLEQVWARREDMVTVTFELLEFKTRPVLEAPDVEAPELVPEGEEGERTKKIGDDMFFTSSATAELVLHERLQKDLVTLRNKSVRRVEWRLEGCTRLLDCCRAGDSVDSPIFSAAGLERLQFHFYPKGYDPATGSTSPCSLFVSGPDRGFSIRGVLWVGSQNRQFEHRFKSRGDVGGRSKFCALEQLLDPQDGVLIAMDVTEVEQELPERQQSLVLRERPNSSAFDVTSPMSPGKSLVSVPPATSTKASIRMKREDPSKTEQLVKCVSLPSLKAGTISQMSLTSSMRSRRSHDF